MSTELSQNQNNALSNEPRAAARTQALRPYFEVESGKSSHEVRVYLPGVPKGEARVSLEGRRLTVEGSRKSPVEEGWKAVRRELPFGDYQLVLDLNVEIDDQKISARSEDGVLHVTLPVAKEALPRTISID